MTCLLNLLRDRPFESLDTALYMLGVFLEDLTLSIQLRDLLPSIQYTF
jgi:hypothetical protein